MDLNSSLPVEGQHPSESTTLRNVKIRNKVWDWNSSSVGEETWSEQNMRVKLCDDQSFSSSLLAHTGTAVQVCQEPSQHALGQLIHEYNSYFICASVCVVVLFSSPSSCHCFLGQSCSITYFQSMCSHHEWRCCGAAQVLQVPKTLWHLHVCYTLFYCSFSDLCVQRRPLSSTISHQPELSVIYHQLQLCVCL